MVPTQEERAKHFQIVDPEVCKEFKVYWKCSSGVKDKENFDLWEDLSESGDVVHRPPAP